MKRVTCYALAPILAAGVLVGSACSLRRPDVLPARMIEPEIPEQPAQAVPAERVPASSVVAVRLLETQARAQIGRKLLHQRADGELVEDPVWRWSSMPARYLDSALRVALTSSTELRLVDTPNVPTVGVTLTAWRIEGGTSTRLAGAIELVVVAEDRTVRTLVLRASEPVSSELPGDLAAATGRLLRTLSDQTVARVAQTAR